MQKKQQTEKRDAFTLFPDLMQNLVTSPRAEKNTISFEKPAAETSVQSAQVAEADRNTVVPPLAPDLSWLRQGRFEEQEEVEDIPAVLLLLGPGDQGKILFSNWQELGYRVEMADTPGQAIEKLMSIPFAAVLLHTGFEGKPLARSLVHSHIAWLPTTKRRTIFYIITGPDVHTLYDLEALSLSANLVINDEDIHQLAPILRKSFREYEELFGPLIETLSGYGKEA